MFSPAARAVALVLFAPVLFAAAGLLVRLATLPAELALAALLVIHLERIQLAAWVAMILPREQLATGEQSRVRTAGFPATAHSAPAETFLEFALLAPAAIPAASALIAVLILVLLLALVPAPAPARFPNFQQE